MMTRALLTMIVCLVLVGDVAAQTTAPAATTTTTTTTTTTPADGRLDFGLEGLSFPPVVIVNGHTPRTAQLLGEAYRRKEPLVWKRVQYIADIGQVHLAAGAPYLIEAMTDAAPQVRAEAARAAAMVGEASLLPPLEKLLGDADASVRREAVLAAAKIAREQKQTSSAITRGLGDRQPSVIAAALQAAWTPDDAAQIAKTLPTLSKELQVDAALALARLKATEHAAAVLPMFSGDVVQRIAAVRAFGAFGAFGQRGQLEAVVKLLKDPHPTVRREAVLALGKLDTDITRSPVAITMLSDTDPTVREAAARVLTPVASSEALAAIAAQLDIDYAPLHEAARQALIRPANESMRAATITLAAKMLEHANPRRQEDASFVLGRLRSDAAIDRHISLLTWDAATPTQADWAVIAQAAESLGLIGDIGAATPLMVIVKAAPEALAKLQRPQRDDMSRAMANALLALARLRHRAAIAESARVLQFEPGLSPSDLRASAAFAIGVLSEPGAPLPEGVNLLAIYYSPDEGHAAKVEAIKALGNMRHAPSANALKQISELDGTPDLRWIAHWAYQRAANVRTPYTPPSERREPPVSISALAK